MNQKKQIEKNGETSNAEQLLITFCSPRITLDIHRMSSVMGQSSKCYQEGQNKNNA